MLVPAIPGTDLFDPSTRRWHPSPENYQQPLANLNRKARSLLGAGAPSYVLWAFRAGDPILLQGIASDAELGWVR